MYLPSLAQAQMPHNGKKFCAKERRRGFVYLGVINLQYGLNQAKLETLPTHPDPPDDSIVGQLTLLQKWHLVGLV